MGIGFLDFKFIFEVTMYPNIAYIISLRGSGVSNFFSVYHTQILGIWTVFMSNVPITYCSSNSEN